jgi:hypothetical protein
MIFKGQVGPSARKTIDTECVSGAAQVRKHQLGGRSRKLERSDLPMGNIELSGSQSASEPTP